MAASRGAVFAARKHKHVLETASSALCTGLYKNLGKRTLDLVLGVPLALLALPVIFLLAFAVVLSSGWPPFYRGVRVGKDGRLFHIWKLRTMVRHADRQLQEWRTANSQLADAFFKDFKLEDDPRITRLGALLRRTSLDELPQLLNVIRGEMSLVGPRPIVPAELRYYGDSAHLLLAWRPGLTGLWQVSGRNRICYPERVQVELEGCASTSMTRDLRLLVRTAGVLLRHEGL
jgi:lipopolysaccharide/colanic/teichoic acid biosynthesis glycosyltransferase